MKKFSSLRKGSLRKKSSSTSINMTDVVSSSWNSQTNLLNDVLLSPQVLQIGNQADGECDLEGILISALKTNDANMIQEWSRCGAEGF